MTSLRSEVINLKSELSRLQLQLASIQATSPCEGEFSRHKSISTPRTAPLTRQPTSNSSQGLENEFCPLQRPPPVTEIIIPAAGPYGSGRQRSNKPDKPNFIPGSVVCKRQRGPMDDSSRDIHVTSRYSVDMGSDCSPSRQAQAQDIFICRNSIPALGRSSLPSPTSPSDSQQNKHTLGTTGSKRPSFSYRTVKQIRPEKDGKSDRSVSTPAADRASIFRPKSDVALKQHTPIGRNITHHGSGRYNASNMSYTWQGRGMSGTIERPKQILAASSRSMTTSPRDNVSGEAKLAGENPPSHPIQKRTNNYENKSKRRGFGLTVSRRFVPPSNGNQKGLLVSEISKNDVRLRSVQLKKKAPSSPNGAFSGLDSELIAAIKGGVHLKHVDAAPEKQIPDPDQTLAISPLLARLQERKLRHLQRMSKEGAT